MSDHLEREIENDMFTRALLCRVAMHLDRMTIHRDLDPCLDHTDSAMHIGLHIAFIYSAVSIYKERTEVTLSHYGAQSTPSSVEVFLFLQVQKCTVYKYLAGSYPHGQ